MTIGHAATKIGGTIIMGRTFATQRGQKNQPMTDILLMVFFFLTNHIEQKTR